MPGDPLRAKYIAEKFLLNAALVNNVRGVCGYTGKYNGSRVSVMASGMGMPSMSIYAHELYAHFDVEAIIRTGSAGALSGAAQLRDVVIAEKAVTDSNIINSLGGQTLAPLAADNGLVCGALASADKLGIKAINGTLYSSDVFYAPKGHNEKWSEKAIAVEMEAAALYAVAAQHKKRALAICTISDNALTGDGLSAAERERSFDEMILIALNLQIP